MGLRRKEKTASKRMSAAQKRKFIALAGLVFLCAVFIVGIFIPRFIVMYTGWTKIRLSRTCLYRGLMYRG